MRAAPLAGLPANLILGTPAPRRLLVQRLLDARAPAECWAVLDNAGIGLESHAAPGLGVATLADACMCCNAITMKVVLTRLLREVRPCRLLILPSLQANIPQLLRLLSDQWLAPVLHFRATLAATEVPEDPAWDGLRNSDEQSLLSQAQLIVLEEAQGEKSGRSEAARIALGRALPRTRIVAGADVHMRLLDEAGPAKRPWFAGQD